MAAEGCIGGKFPFDDEDDVGATNDGRKTEEDAFFRVKSDSPWNKMSRLEKSLVLNKIADGLEKCVQFVSVLEHKSTNRIIHRVRYDDLPFCIRVFLCLPVFASLSVVVSKLVPALCSGNNVRICLYGSQSSESGVERSGNFALLYLQKLLKEFEEIKDVVKFFYTTKPVSVFFDRPSFLSAVNRFHLNFVGTIQEAELLREKIPYFSACFDYRTCVVVFDGCDVYGAVDAVVRSLSSSADRIPDFRVLVQVRLFRAFVRHLVKELEHLVIGLDVTADSSRSIEDYVGHLKGIEESCVEEVRCGGFDVLSFRTSKEAIELANDSLQDVRASIWAQDISLALEVAKKVSASTVWVNSIDVYDPAVPVAHLKRSGNCVDGGGWGVEHFKNLLEPIGDSLVASTDLVLVASSVDSKSWASLSPFRRSEICLSAFQELIREKNELSRYEYGSESVDCLIEDFGFWASKCASGDTAIQDTDFDGNVIVSNIPIGSILFTIGVLHPIELFVNFALSAVSFGNTATVTIEERLIPFCEEVVHLLTSKGFPPGIVKVLGSRCEPIPSAEFDAHFVLDLDYSLRRSPRKSGKFPVVVKYGDDEEFWEDVDRIGNDRFLRSLISNFTRPKTVWLSSGVSFAN